MPPCYHVTRKHTMPAFESYIAPSNQGLSGASENVAFAAASMLKKPHIWPAASCKPAPPLDPTG